MATGLTQGSRVIVTCRYLPEETPTDLPTVLHLPLPDLHGVRASGSSSAATRSWTGASVAENFLPL